MTLLQAVWSLAREYDFWLLFLVWLFQFVHLCRVRRRLKVYQRWYQAAVQQSQQQYQSQQYRGW